jgi:hypothetical protein
LESRLFGLTSCDNPKFPFDVAEEMGPLKLNKVKRMIGWDWPVGFRMRHPELSLREPEAIAAARRKVLIDHRCRSLFTFPFETYLFDKDL